MAPNLIGGGLIDLVDDWLLKQKPRLGAGQSPPPGPGPQAPSRIGATNQMQPFHTLEETLGAPGGTAPFLPAKIGAGPVPGAPVAAAPIDPTVAPPKIGAPMPTAPDTT